ncbi:MAG: hypothetical protein K1Y36_25840 [Blastocatellia bacterium]|nr:hypothetical protein [Blastocatellia bacterium]
MASEAQKKKLRRGLDLAYWIIPDEETAWKTVTLAAEAIQNFTKRQDERSWYRGFWEKKGVRVNPTKPFLCDDQPFQVCVLEKIEPFELTQEAAGIRLTDEDFAVRYVKFLVRTAYKANAFHALIGLGKLVFSYSTRNLIDLNKIIDPLNETKKEEPHYRGKKKKLMATLQERFGTRLEIRKREHSELTFRLMEQPELVREAVKGSLGRFTLWNSFCFNCGPSLSLSSASHANSNKNPGSPKLPSQNTQAAPPGAALSENSRCHLIINPECFMKLTNHTGLQSPWERMAIPAFAQTNDHPPGGETKGDRWNPPHWDEAKIDLTLDELRRKADQRKQVEPVLLSVQLDGKVLHRINFDQARQLSFCVPETAGLLEIRDEKTGLLLVSHLLAEWNTAGEPDAFVFRFKGRRVIRLKVLFLEALDPAELGQYSVDIGFKRLAVWEWWAGLVTLPAWFDLRLAVAATALCFLSTVFGLYWLWSGVPQADPIARKTGPVQPPTPVTPPTTSQQGQPPPQIEPKATMPTQNSEPLTGITRSAQGQAGGLATVKKVMVEAQGFQSDRIKAVLAEALTSTGPVTVTDEDSLADALVEAQYQDKTGSASIRLRLINSQGKVLWSKTERIFLPPSEENISQAVQNLTLRLGSAIKRVQPHRNNPELRVPERPKP